MEEVLAKAGQGVKTSEYVEALRVMAQHILAVHRAPDPYDDIEDPPMKSYREVCLAHLTDVESDLNDASSYEDLNDVQNQLLKYSQVMGNTAFSDFTTSPFFPTEAGPWTYSVEPKIDDTTISGPLLVRKDPMVRE